MTSVVRGLLTLTLVALLAVAVQAQDKKAEKKPAKPKDPYAGAFAFPKQVKLDDKQKEQIEKLQAEYSPKLAELAKKQTAIVPADRIKAANEARKKASDAILTPDRVKAAKEATKGKKGKEAQQAYQEALKLTPEEQKQLKGVNKVYDEALNLSADEKKQLADVNKERGALIKEINTKKQAILTDEQKEAIKPKAKPKKDK